MTTIDKLQTAADLRSAAAYINEHGWHQGVWRGENGAVCAVGGLVGVLDAWSPTNQWTPGLMVGETRARFDTARDELEALLWRNGSFEDATSVEAWNDAQGRTREDVTGLMEKTAAWLEEQA